MLNSGRITVPSEPTHTGTPRLTVGGSDIRIMPGAAGCPRSRLPGHQFMAAGPARLSGELLRYIRYSDQGICAQSCQAATGETRLYFGLTIQAGETVT